MKKYCPVCGKNTIHAQYARPIDYIPGLSRAWRLSPSQTAIFNIREGRICQDCWSSSRVQGLAAACGKITGSRSIEGFIKACNRRQLKVAEINACGSLHARLQKLNNLHYSEYYDSNEQLGSNNKFSDVRHENIMSLSYSDNSFDIVLHSETLEHIVDPKKAIEECMRVLRPGGYCIFTTPVIWNRRTLKKFEISDFSQVAPSEPVSYHGDAKSRYPVLFEFGWDIGDIIKQPSVVCYAHEPESQSYVFMIRKAKNVPDFVKTYPISVEKIKTLKLLQTKAEKGAIGRMENLEDEKLINDGERMVPEFHKDHLFYAEHMTRYNQTETFIKGKTVLDIASGSGYGTKIISETAKHVYGVDISLDAIKYAQKKYGAKNIEYILGDGERIPLEDNTVDVSVTFETIEHLENYEGFIDELKRVTKEDGLVIVSTPNDLEYGEGNHFHLHEFEYKELFRLLKKRFNYIDSYFQSTWRTVMLGELDVHTSSAMKEMDIINFSPLKDESKTLYFYLVCSNKKITKKLEPVVGIGPHLSEAKEWEDSKKAQAHIAELQENIRTLQEKNDTLSGEIKAIHSSKGYKVVKKLGRAKARMIGRK